MILIEIFDLNLDISATKYRHYGFHSFVIMISDYNFSKIVEIYFYNIRRTFHFWNWYSSKQQNTL